MVTILSRLKWWFFHRFHPKHRYNIVHTGLKPGYWDPSERLLWAIMSATSEYVRLNAGLGENHRDSTRYDDDDHEHWKVFVDAANWWRENENKIFEATTLGEEEEIWQAAEKHMVNIIRNLGAMWYI